MMNKIFTDEQRSQLKSLLAELSVCETNCELNRAMDNHNKEKAVEMIKVEKSIDTLLKYLEG